MEPNTLDERLSRISMQWSMVFQAHRSRAESQPARAELVQRYLRAVYRYLLGAVRDLDVADELCQDFALRLLEGKFHRAHPGRGRFRDYVKPVLINLVRDYLASRGKRPRSPPERLGQCEAAPQTDHTHDLFVQAWREELLEQTWDALRHARPK